MADEEDILPVTIPRFAAARERIHQQYNTAQSAIAGGGGSLREREFTYKQQEDAKDRVLKEHAAAVHEASGYLDVANNLAKMQQEAEQKVQAADFLTKAKDIPVTDPNYENKIATLHAQLPYAAGHQAVQDYLNVNHPARQLFLQGQEKGTIPGEASTRQALAAGLLMPEDFQWTDSANRPAIYNPDGTVNHQQAAWIASGRQGAQEGVKAEALRSAQNMKIIDAGLKLKDDLNEPENSNLKTLFQQALKEEAARHTPASTTAAPSAVPPPAVPGVTPSPALGFTTGEDFTKAFASASPGAVLYYQGKPYTKPKP
jgi:hypothetical protein